MDAAVIKFKEGSMSKATPNFTSVAGTAALHALVESSGSAVHVIGHSHRPFDFVVPEEGVGRRYLHKPLAYPSERKHGDAGGADLMQPILSLP